jgi:flagellar P-ring protein precursor FlgI
VYGLAQGNLIVGGFGISGDDGSRVSVNVPSTGRVPNGATVERFVPSVLGTAESLVLNLNTPDFTTAARLTDSINASLGAGTAETLDPISVRVRAPAEDSQRVAYLSHIENLEVEPAEAAAKVIVNSRTGTVVIGSNVRVTPAAVAHGSLVVRITETALVSQPNPLGVGQTVVVGQSDIDVDQGSSRMFVFEPGATLNAIVEAVNQVGAAPGDLVAILEALREAGALRAQLIVI